MNHNELRKKFLNYFEKKGHKIVSSSPVIPYNDPTLMFTNAGMNQFKDVLTGKEKRSYTRAASVQKCIRVSGKHNDFEIVGFDGTHHTFFEMLGNWSFGDYYKKEAIEFAWEFLINELNFKEDKLAVSIYKDDNESYEIWKNVIGIPENKIIRLGDIEKGDEENFWSMGEVGPCGPCTEIHYKAFNNYDYISNEEGYSPDYIELWNLVFMEFYRDEKGSLTPLKFKSVDTGMGFERLYTLLQGKSSNYHTDLFMPIINHLESLLNKKYKDNEVSFQVVADHIRALTFAIGDGGNFSNEGRGYVLRKILRRAERHLKKVGATEPILYTLVDDVVNIMGEFYTDLKEKKEEIKKFIKIEEEKFLTTLETGLNQISIIISKLKKENKAIIDGKDVFMLYDTYGFPVDITKEIAKENNLKIDETGYNKYMEEQRKRGKASWAGHSEHIKEEVLEILLKEKKESKFIGYDFFKSESIIEALILDNELVEEISNKEKIIGILLNETPFYAEMGGQVGDTGIIYNNNFQFKVEDTQKYGNHYIHWGKIIEGSTKVNEKVKAEVDKKRRLSIMRNHTATHLLQAALKKVVGKHIMQAGSYVGEDRLRFDFRHYSSLSREEIKTIELIVNDIIEKNIFVEKFIKDKEDAIKMGATAIFGEKYGEKVRVVKVNDFSMELCGGTHVNRTGDIGVFIILSESSISAGVRRIEAITGLNAIKYIQNKIDTLKEITQLLKINEENIFTRIEQIISQNKELEKKLKNKKFSSLEDILKELKNKATRQKNGIFVIHKFSNEDNKLINTVADKLKKELKNSIIFFINNVGDKVTLLLVVDEENVKKGIDAVDLINKLVNPLGGKGGGRKDRAQAGGKFKEKISKLIEDANALFSEILK